MQSVSTYLRSIDWENKYVSKSKKKKEQKKKKNKDSIHIMYITELLLVSQ